MAQNEPRDITTKTNKMAAQKRVFLDVDPKIIENNLLLEVRTL